MIIGQLKSIWRAFGFARQGLLLAVRKERAFRQELAIFIPGTVLAFFLARDAVEFALLVLPLTVVLIVELINSAIEAAIDRISDEVHPLSGEAKDFAAAAAMLSQATTAVIWIVYLYHRFWGETA